MESVVDPSKPLGKGAFGVVNKIPGNGGVPAYFALKSIPIEPLLAWRYFRNIQSSQARSTLIISKLWNEVTLLNNLNHDHVVRYYDSWIKGPDKEELEKLGKGEPNKFDLSFLESCSSTYSSKDSIPSKNHFQIKMEYCESDLKKWISTRPLIHFEENKGLRIAPDSCVTALELFRQTMLGLEYIHSKGVIHRDLKPENIFLQSSPSSSKNTNIKMIVKIGDFGLSRQVAEDLDETNLTTHLGTPQYQSPEMWAGRGYTEKTDIFSAGLLLYEMLHTFLTLISRSEAFIDLSEVRLENSLVQRFVPDFRVNFPNECCLVHKMTKVANPNERPGAGKILAEIVQIQSSRRLQLSASTPCVTPSKSSSAGVQLNLSLVIDETPGSLESLGDKNNKPTSASPSKNKAISFGVMKPTTFFTGRNAEVKQLAELFLNQCPPKIVVISGMGGQGKTELCRQFIKTLKNRNSPPAVTWLGGDNAANLTSSIVQLAQSLPIPTTIEGKPIPLTQLLVQVGDNISTNYSSSGWLVVIDNVDKVYPELKKVVHLLVRHGAFVLATTRKIDILTGGSKQMKLDVMKEDDAHSLIRKCLDQPQIEEDVHHLCNELGNHALALRQAVAYINAQQVENRTSYGIKDYLDDFAKDKTLLNDQDHFVEDYNQTIFLIVSRAIKTIYDKHGRLGRKAAGLMEILSLILPDGISVECLQKFHNILQTTKTQKWHHKILNRFRASTEDINLNQALQLLKKYSLITFDDGSFLSIHRLVQKVAKCHSSSEASRLISKTIEPEKCSKEELRQVMHIWEQANSETVKECPNLPKRIFHRMVDLSLVLEMMPFAINNHQLLAKLLGPDDMYTLIMEHNLARALKENGDYETALTKFLEVLEKKKQALGAEHPETMITASQLANVFYRLNRFEDALEWDERVLEYELRLYGSDHNYTMNTRQGMALQLHKLGRMDEALTLYNQVLEWRMENQGPSHLYTLNTRYNMAVVLCDQDKLEEAKAEFEAMLKLNIEVLGEEHASTFRTKHWLATTHWKLGMREEALKMNQEVLASREKVLGPNHPDTIFTRNAITQWLTELESSKINIIP